MVQATRQLTPDNTERDDGIVTGWNEGLSVKQLSVAFDLHPNTIRKILRKRGA